MNLFNFKNVVTKALPIVLGMVIFSGSANAEGNPAAQVAQQGAKAAAAETAVVITAVKSSSIDAANQVLVRELGAKRSEELTAAGFARFYNMVHAPNSSFDIAGLEEAVKENPLPVNALLKAVKNVSKSDVPVTSSLLLANARSISSEALSAKSKAVRTSDLKASDLKSLELWNTAAGKAEALAAYAKWNPSLEALQNRKAQVIAVYNKDTSEGKAMNLEAAKVGTLLSLAEKYCTPDVQMGAGEESCEATVNKVVEGLVLNIYLGLVSGYGKVLLTVNESDPAFAGKITPELRSKAQQFIAKLPTEQRQRVGSSPLVWRAGLGGFDVEASFRFFVDALNKFGMPQEAAALLKGLQAVSNMFVVTKEDMTALNNALLSGSIIDFSTLAKVDAVVNHDAAIKCALGVEHGAKGDLSRSLKERAILETPVAVAY